MDKEEVSLTLTHSPHTPPPQENNSAIKMKFLAFAYIWMNLENIMHSEMFDRERQI